MKFAAYAKYLEQVESISGRNDMIAILAELFKGLDPAEIKEAVYMLQGRIAPLFVPLEFSFSTKLVLRSLASISGQNPDELLAVYKQKGDIGIVAGDLRSSARSKGLGVRDVFRYLLTIATTGGKNSQTEKQKIFLELAKQTSALEIRYICKILVGALRLGVSNKSMLDGLSVAKVGNKDLREEIERAFGVRADLGEIALITLTQPIEDLHTLKIQAGIPLASKLVEREKLVEEVFKRLGPCFVQPKYDGLRTQIHYSKKGFAEADVIQEKSLLGPLEDKPQVRIFSRNMEDYTPMFPDIVAAIKTFKVDSLILDAESIGFNPQTGHFFPFQETSKRRRKNDISGKTADIPLRAFCFDLLMLNGKDLLQMPLKDRIPLLQKLMKDNPSDSITAAETPLIETEVAMAAKFKEYVDAGLEGLIAKGIDTTYDPGTRNFDWIKLKAASQSELADTVDAVVLGYYHGGGVRAKFGIGAILIGLYDNDRDQFVSLAKVGTGIKDDEWKTIKQQLDAIKVDQLPENVAIDKALFPDVFVSPQIVVVVEADQITQSKLHGGGEGEIGLSLRFPRLKQFGRDKLPEQATTLQELQQLFKLQ